MHDLQRYLSEEVVEEFATGRLSRRRAVRMLAGLTGAALAARLLDAAGAPQDPVVAGTAEGASQRVAPDDPAVHAETVHFPGEDAELIAYLARPALDGAHPVVLICHENRGLTPHIRDVTRRVGKAGYVGLAVDLLSREGGTEHADPDRVPALLGNAPPHRPVQDFQSGLGYLGARAFARADRAGMVGFCYGGGVTWRVAAATPNLRAAVPFYGSPVAPEDIPRIHAAVLAIYAGRDSRINASIPATEAAMRGAGRTYRKLVVPDVEHGFHNDTGSRYDAAAAQMAWDETLRWLRTYLAG